MRDPANRFMAAAALLAATTACKHTEEPIETSTMSASQATDEATAASAATEPATTSPTHVGPLTTGVTDDPETTNVGPVTSSSSSGTTGDAPTTGDTDGADSPCCVPQETPGCPADPVIEACVCAQDELCCDPEFTWDDFCVLNIAAFGCGGCSHDDTTTGDTTGG